MLIHSRTVQNDLQYFTAKSMLYRKIPKSYFQPAPWTKPDKDFLQYCYRLMLQKSERDSFFINNPHQNKMLFPNKRKKLNSYNNIHSTDW